MQDKEVTRAGFGPRAAAYIIDRAVLLVGLAIVRAPFAIASFFGGGQLTAKTFLFDHSFMDVLSWVLVSAYFVLLTYFGGSTLGKMVMRLHVRKADGSELGFIDALYRETVGRFLCGILCLGYLMVLVDKQNRSFADWLCGTEVIYDEVVFRSRGGKTRAPAAGWTPAEPAAPAVTDPETAAPAEPETVPLPEETPVLWSIPGETPAPAEAEIAPEQEAAPAENEEGGTDGI